MDFPHKGRYHSALDDARNTADIYLAVNNTNYQKTLKMISELFEKKKSGSSIGELFPELSSFALGT